MVNRASVLFFSALVLTVLPVRPSLAQDELGQMQLFLDLVDKFYGVLETTHGLSADPEKAAILQMHKIQEAYEQRGEKARAIEVFREVLDTSSNPTIRNAAYLMLGDALKETGRTNEAVELLRDGLKENLANAK